MNTELKDDYGELNEFTFSAWWALCSERIPKSLAKIRSEKGISQRQMAKLLEVSPSTISATESGKSAVSTKLLLGYAYFCRYPLSRFADIDDVDIDENLKKTINKLFDDNGQKVLNSFLDVLSKTCTQN